MAITVTYNGYTLPNVYGKFTYRENEVDVNFSCTFLIQKSTASTLVTECLDAETKLTEKCKDLTLSFSGSNELSFSHSGNTGFSIHTHLNKIDAEISTETSRAYSFSANVQLPFTQSGYNARREASFNVSYLPTRQRLVSFSLLYTSTPGVEALANYTTYGKTWAGTILTALTGNYELIDESFNEEQEQKIINAKLTYKEILTNQSSSGVNDTSLVDPQMTYGCSMEQQVGKGIITGVRATPIVRLQISYSTKLDKDVVGTDLNTAYKQRVRPYMIAQVFATLGANEYRGASSSNYIVESESKNIDTTNYTISGGMVLLAFTASQIIAYSETINQVDNPNITFKKLWDGMDDTYNMYSMGKTRTMQRIVTIAQLNAEPAAPASLINERAPDGCTWIKVFPTSVHGKVDTWGYGSSGTTAALKMADVYFFTFTEQYLAVRAASGSSYMNNNVLR